MLQKIKRSAEYIHKIIESKPNKALILGSGLGGFIRDVEILHEIPYRSIPDFPQTTVEGHSGNLIHARIGDKEILIMQGRIHYYEGYSMEQLAYPVRVLKYLGVEYLFLSNASGGMNPEYNIGDLMIITDHINLMPNPLIGAHSAEFGARFPDMSQAYSKELINHALKLAASKKIQVHQGVYVATTGPTYETPAEYRYFRIIGGDAVGMSTVPEAIVANQMGMKCFAISVITDLGISGKIETITHEQVQLAASKAEPRMATIMKDLILQF